MKKILQIGVVVNSLDVTMPKVMALFGIKECPPYNKVGREFGDEECGTIYEGDDKSMASCLTCCFDFENIQLEYIQPYGDGPSEWKRFLEEKGEGIHHLGFKMLDVDETRKDYAKLGYQEVQCGCWGTGEYHYFNTSKDIGFAIENMLFYNE